MAKELIDHSKDVNMNWRSIGDIYNITNALLTGYQIALWRTLGSGMGAMTQLLIKELGELMADITNHLEHGESGQSIIDVHVDKGLGEIIKKYLERLSIAKDIKVEKLEAVEKYGRLLERFKIEIRDSIFMPAHRALVRRGVKEFPLSPEGLLIAAIIKRFLQRDREDSSVRVKVDTFLPEREDDPLVVYVEEIHPLK